jgi:hypothetical protein
MSKGADSFKTRAPARCDPVTVLLKHPHHPVLNPANAAEPVEDAVPEPICATFAEYVAITLWKSDLIAKATEASP